MRFLVGLEQLSLGLRTRCDLFDSEGEVAVPEDTAISSELLAQLKLSPAKGLFTERKDYLQAEKPFPRVDIDTIALNSGRMKERADIPCPVSESSRREALALARETISEARQSNPIDYWAIVDVAMQIQRDLRERGFVAMTNHLAQSPSEYLTRHSVNSMINMLSISARLGVDDDEARKLAVGAFLHDIGKVQVDGMILAKPESLTEEEYMEIQKHPMFGLRIVMRGIDLGDEACKVVLHHHERYDGRGYPMKLGRSTISRAGRMMAVIDAYDAMTNDRVYARKLTGHEALSRIITSTGSQFDPHYAHEFLAMNGAYPAGSVVELNSGEIGVVTSQNEASLVSPNLQVFFNPSRRELNKPMHIDLTRDPSRYIKRELDQC